HLRPLSPCLSFPFLSLPLSLHCFQKGKSHTLPLSCANEILRIQSLPHLSFSRFLSLSLSPLALSPFDFSSHISLSLSLSLSHSLTYTHTLISATQGEDYTILCSIPLGPVHHSSKHPPPLSCQCVSVLLYRVCV